MRWLTTQWYFSASLTTGDNIGNPRGGKGLLTLVRCPYTFTGKCKSWHVLIQKYANTGSQKINLKIMIPEKQ